MNLAATRVSTIVALILGGSSAHAAPICATSDGNNNTACGTGSFSSATSVDNTAIGEAALAADTSGNYNTAAGMEALQLNQTGASNVAVGTQALGSATSGSFNVAVGNSALYNNNASSNVAVG